MKNILVPTDFSPNAHQAAIYAALLARQLQVRLVLFHALPMTAQAKDGLDPETRAQARLDALAFELHSLYQVSTTRLLRPGFAVDEIPLMANRIKAELVVMGACGENQLAGQTMGAVTNELLKNPLYPLVCIPPGLPHSLLKTLPGLEMIPEHFCTERGLKKLHKLLQTPETKDTQAV